MARLGGGGHTVNPKALKAEASRSHEFKDSLVFRMRSRTTRTTQKNPVSGRKRVKPEFEPRLLINYFII